MLVPDIKKTNKENLENDIITIDSINRKEAFYNVDILFSEKEKCKFIKKIERMIRSSVEYKTYIGLLKSELNLTKCTFIPGLDINTVKVGLEFHHYPFTLFDLVSIEIEKDISNNIKFIDPFDIADRVMINHYKNLVGLVPLSVTVHELVHAGKKFVNKKYVYGNYEAYIDKYAKYITEEFDNKLAQINDLSEREDNGEDIDNGILDVKLLKVIVNDIEPARPIPVSLNEAM